MGKEMNYNMVDLISRAFFRFKKIRFALFLFSFTVISCEHITSSKNRSIYLEDFINGELKERKLNFDSFIVDNEIKTPYLRELKAYRLIDIKLENNNPDKMEFIGKPMKLDFDKEPKKNSPEYFALSLVYHIGKAIKFYNKLFDNRLNFNSQDAYLKTKMYLGNAAYVSNPSNYIVHNHIDPTLIYHEVGHRAFWMIEGQLKINLGQPISYLHMGLLEYFSAAIGNYPVIMGRAFPESLVRNLDQKFLFTDKVMLSDTIQDADNTWGNLKDPWHKKFISSYRNILNKIKRKIEDPHRAALRIAAPLWSLRKKVGGERVDQLVADSILNLCSEDNCSNQNQLPHSWSAFYNSLLQMDKKKYNSKYESVITQTFKNFAYPL